MVATIEQPVIPGFSEADLIAWLKGQGWSDFARDLVQFHASRGHLTDRQVSAAVAFRERQVARTAAKPSVEPVPAVPPLPIGTFTLELPSGHRTFRTQVQAADADFAPGEVIISFLSGSDNESDFTGFAFVKGTPESPRLTVWKRFQESEELLAHAELLLSDPFADSVLLAKNCMACGRKLTRPSSVHANIGPECAKRFG